MNISVDSDWARIFRWLVLPLAAIAAVVGFVLMPLVPGRPESLSDYAFRLAPIIAAFSLTLLAAWLRKNEANPANEATSSKSLLRHFALYSALVIGICLVAAVFLH